MVLVAQGRSVESLQSAVRYLEGSATLQITLDTKIEIPWSPDLRLGWAVKSGLWTLEKTIRAIPHVNLNRKITWVDDGEQGVLTISARENMPIVLAPIVAALLPWLIGLGIILVLAVIGWKVFQAAARGAGRAVEKIGGGFGIVLMVVGIVAVVMIASGKGRIAGVG